MLAHHTISNILVRYMTHHNPNTHTCMPKTVIHYMIEHHIERSTSLEDEIESDFLAFLLSIAITKETSRCIFIVTKNLS